MGVNCGQVSAWHPEDIVLSQKFPNGFTPSNRHTLESGQPSRTVFARFCKEVSFCVSLLSLPCLGRDNRSVCSILMS